MKNYEVIKRALGDIEPIKSILLTHESSHRRQAHNQDEISDDFALYIRLSSTMFVVGPTAS